jgi:murein DD-endopeptidase MepM/ murein hydrolase activator NlpD
LDVEHLFLGQGGTLAAVSERIGLSADERIELLSVADEHLDLRRLSPRTGISVQRQLDGTPFSVAIRAEKERFLRISLPQRAADDAGDVDATDGANADGMQAQIVRLDYRTEIETEGGTVTSSVAQALGHLSQNQFLTQAYADIFQWDVDLLVDPRPGDEVRIVYETRTLGEVPHDLPRFGDAALRSGEFVGIGRILAARYDGAVANGVAYWVEEGPNSGNYFDDQGQPLRKSFLKSPLNYRRISSRCSKARRNPVTRKVVPHHGVDFAASSGTPVTATADGRIISAGWDGPLGKAVRLRHGGEYVTIYGHLRGFARGIKSGVEVSQGQVIGYVGATGRATGPHLHYTVVKNGRAIDPLKMKNPTAKRLEERLMPTLNASRLRWDPLLTELELSTRVDVADGKPTAVDPNAVLSGS